MLTALPMELVAMACCFVSVDDLARLRRTCKAFRSGLVDAWHDALVVPGGAWYELKDVALTARYADCKHRVPSAPPSSLDTTEHIAFWGTFVDENEGLLATFGPTVLTFKADLGTPRYENGGSFSMPNLVFPGSLSNLADIVEIMYSSEDLRVIWQTPELQASFTAVVDISDCVNSTEQTWSYFEKPTRINMYATVNFHDCIGLYHIVSDNLLICPCRSWSLTEEGNVFQADSTLLELGGSAVLVDPGRVRFAMFDASSPGLSAEWLKAYNDADCEGRDKMELDFAMSPANAGRGWNATRLDLIEQFVKMCTPFSSVAGTRFHAARFWKTASYLRWRAECKLYCLCVREYSPTA